MHIRRGLAVLAKHKAARLAKGPQSVEDGRGACCTVGSVRRACRRQILAADSVRSLCYCATLLLAGSRALVEPIAPEELWLSKEVFMTGTSASIVPVESIDGRPLGEVCPGPLTQRLRATLLEIETGQDPSFDHWLTYVEETPV